MQTNVTTELISTLGFPIVCVIALAWFAFYIIKQTEERNQKREDKLYDEIAQCREINAKAVDTIAQYAESFTVIKQDLKEVKADIKDIKSKG